MTRYGHLSTKEAALGQLVCFFVRKRKRKEFAATVSKLYSYKIDQFVFFFKENKTVLTKLSLLKVYPLDVITRVQI